MEIKFNEKDKLLVLKITEEIDEYQVQEMRRKADYEIERYMPKKVIFDFNNVTFMDSAGIGLIIGRYKFTNIQPKRRIFEQAKKKWRYHSRNL